MMRASHGQILSGILWALLGGEVVFFAYQQAGRVLLWLTCCIIILGLYMRWKGW